MPNDIVTTNLPSTEIINVKSQLSFSSPVSQLPLAVKPTWLHAVSHLDPKYGGLSAAVPNLSRALSNLGERNISVIGFCLPSETNVPGDLDIQTVPLSRLDWLKHRNLGTKFRQWVAQSTGLHIHGLWQQSSAVAGPTARDFDRPYVVSAHGMLESWAMANKRWKKALYMSMVEGANLRGAACLHALTSAEAEDYRRLHLTNPVAVIPNGVTVPLERSPESFLQQFPSLRGKQIVLFLGRIHYKKGLDILLRAWADMKKTDEAHLVLAGPDFEDTQQRMESLVDELKIRPSVTFTGMLQSSLKWGAIQACRAFVLPSYSEGLSVSVLEAMGAGKPVVITDNCNLPEVKAHGCGWVIPPESSALQSALEEVVSSSSSQLSYLGKVGEQLVLSRYSWPVVGKQMNSLYGWLEGGDEPSNVDLRFFNGATQ